MDRTKGHLTYPKRLPLLLPIIVYLAFDCLKYSIRLLWLFLGFIAFKARNPTLSFRCLLFNLSKLAKSLLVVHSLINYSFESSEQLPKWTLWAALAVAALFLDFFVAVACREYSLIWYALLTKLLLHPIEVSEQQALHVAGPTPQPRNTAVFYYFHFEEGIRASEL